MGQSKNEILTNLYTNPLLDEIIWKITNSPNGRILREDLKSELFLILVEMSDVRIKTAHRSNYLIYMCVNILKKQYHSGSSPFFKKWRKEMGGDFIVIDDVCGDDLDLEQMEIDFENIELLEKIKWIVDNKLDLVDRELFKLYYKWDRYDRWLGDLKDVTCDKEMSSYRKIEKKLTITPLDGEKKIGISRNTIAISHQRSIEKIKKWLRKI